MQYGISQQGLDAVNEAAESLFGACAQGPPEKDCEFPW